MITDQTGTSVHRPGIAALKQLVLLGSGNEECLQGVDLVEALEIDGVTPLSFTGRKMGGMVDVSETAIADDRLRPQIVGMALNYARSLPPK